MLMKVMKNSKNLKMIQTTTPDVEEDEVLLFLQQNESREDEYKNLNHYEVK